MYMTNMLRLSKNDVCDLTEYLKRTRFSNTIEDEIKYIDTISYYYNFNIADYEEDTQYYLDRVEELQATIELLS